jgi:hypothetical protein
VAIFEVRLELRLGLELGVGIGGKDDDDNDDDDDDDDDDDVVVVVVVVVIEEFGSLTDLRISSGTGILRVRCLCAVSWARRVLSCSGDNPSICAFGFCCCFFIKFI